MKLNPDTKLVEQIKKELKENDGFCPCTIEQSENTKCPCKSMRNDKICICGLYINDENDDKSLNKNAILSKGEFMMNQVNMMMERNIPSNEAVDQYNRSFIKVQQYIDSLPKLNEEFEINNILNFLKTEGVDINNLSKLQNEYINKMAKCKVEMQKAILSNSEEELKKEYGSVWTDILKNSTLTIRIKYFDNATKLKKISKGNWIDVYANKDMFIPIHTRAMIPLGFALELPKGWEAHLAPRSSTFKTWGIIQTNSVGVVDDSYIGDNDQWHLPVYCLEAKDNKGFADEGTHIKKGDKIGQFRIMEIMPEIKLEEVDFFNNEDRGGFGSTGSK